MADDWQEEVDDWEDEAPRPGAAESFARGSAEGVSLGFQDELGGAFGAIGGMAGRDIRGLREGNLELNPATRARRALADYQRWRDVGRAETQAAREANPIAFGAGDIGAGVGTAILTGGGGGLARAAGVGATEGALRGAGSSTSGLPEDVAAGAALGAVGGAAGYGLGKAVGAVRDRFRGLLARARGEATAQEATRAAGEVEKVAKRVEKGREAERRMVGQAREMNRRMGAAPARGATGAQRELTDEELQGYLRQAHNEVNERLLKGEAYRREFGREDVPTRVTSFMQDYIEGVDVNDPQRALMEVARRNLTRRLGPERAAAYFDEQGNILTTAQRQARTAAPLAPELPPEPRASATLPAASRALRDFQVRPDVPTRTYGPEGVQALAGERVLAREQAALPTVLRAGAQGVRGSGNVLGGVVGGTSELARALNDPAVRARLLEEILRLRGGSPALLGRLGGAAGSMAGAEP